MKDFSRLSFRNVKWRFSNQIAITSKTGTGSTTLLELLQATLGPQYSYLSGGRFMRDLQEEYGFPTIESFIDYNRRHPEALFDPMCDQRTREEGKKNNLILEARLAHIFMPYAFKVLLRCPIQKRADRRAHDNNKPFEKVLPIMLDRDIADAMRFDEFYPGWNWGPEDYDYWIDTGVNSKEETLRNVLRAHQMWLQKPSTKKYLIGDLEMAA